MPQRIPDRPASDRLPRRRSERVQCAIGWMLLIAGLMTVVVAAFTASSAYRAGLERIKTDAARIPLGYEAHAPGRLTVVPVGRSFEARKRFGGRDGARGGPR